MEKCEWFQALARGVAIDLAHGAKYLLWHAGQGMAKTAGGDLCGFFVPASWRGNLTGKKGVEHMSSNENTGCTLVVPICEAGRLEAQRQEIAQTLNDLGADIRDLLGKLRKGEVRKQEVGTTLADLRYWLKALRETETELETLKRKESGISESYGLDLEAAAAEIRCRMARLSECCRAE